jgi:hypothetical protein
MTKKLLLGRVPLRPASKMFETVTEHLGALAPRIPDDEMMGSPGVWRAHARQPGSETGRNLRTQRQGDGRGAHLSIEERCSRDGFDAWALWLRKERRGILCRVQATARQGQGAHRTRMQVTMAGPGTTSFGIQLDADVLLPFDTFEAVKDPIKAMQKKEVILPLGPYLQAGCDLNAQFSL